MNPSTLTHNIKCPQKWALQGALDAHLWSKFPMDGFNYIEDPEAAGPEYLGSTVPADPWLTINSSKSTETHVDEVAHAVGNFVAADAAA